MAVKGKKHLAGREVQPGEETMPLEENVAAESDEEFEYKEPEGGTSTQEEGGGVGPQLVSTEQPQQPSPVRENGIMLVNFLGPVFDKEKGNKRIGIELSIPLTDDHRANDDHGARVPQKAIDAWDWLNEQENKRSDLSHIEPQCLEFFLSPEQEEAVMRITEVTIGSAQVAMIEQTGSGDSVIIPRFKFTAWCDWSREVREFVTNDYEIQIWMRMGATQGSLL